MKTIIVAVGALLAVSVPASAVEDESAFTIDLTGGSQDSAVHAYHVKCQYGGDIHAGCGLVSLWEESNGVFGLQSAAGMLVEKSDSRLTP